VGHHQVPRGGQTAHTEDGASEACASGGHATSESCASGGHAKSEA
jgi:hypothetical protein